jgi:hypothetical protein
MRLTPGCCTPRGIFGAESGGWGESGLLLKNQAGCERISAKKEWGGAAGDRFMITHTIQRDRRRMEFEISNLRLENRRSQGGSGLMGLGCLDAEVKLSF